jgi:hypothetical protein
MKLRATTKVLRAVLIAAVLVIGLGSGALDRLDTSRSASAWGCYESMVAFHNAMMNYEVARVSYFYGDPTSCYDECAAIMVPPDPQCIADCEQARATTLSSASISLSSSALVTCTPEPPDGCAQARAMRDDCNAQYNPGNYSSPEEYLAVWSQLSACLEASKVQYCE